MLRIPSTVAATYLARWIPQAMFATPQAAACSAPAELPEGFVSWSAAWKDVPEVDLEQLNQSLGALPQDAELAIEGVEPTAGANRSEGPDLLRLDVLA